MLKLDPEPLCNYFEKISEIPRCSKNEEQIGEYIKSVASENGFDFKQDKAGNIVVRKPATTNKDAPITTLQCHMDMVCEKNEDIAHDFSTDPIPIKKEGKWITAEGTTLGADNGIGVAACLAIATTKNIDHGPLEFLFTIDEETGLNGASKLEPDFIKGHKLINLDSEEFGTFTIGCAGGGKSKISLPLKTKTQNTASTMKIGITGLKGGHSGIDINKGRANSIKILGRLLWKLYRTGNDQILIHKLSGGNKDNAIPRESRATISVKKSAEDAKKLTLKEFEKIRREYKDIEPNMEIKIEKRAKNNKIEILNQESSKRLIYLIQALPHGILSMSQKIRGLVKTSTNLGTVKKEDKKLEIKMKTRSSNKSELEKTRDQIRAISEIFGAKVEENQPYPGWEPNKDSELLEILERTFKDLFNKKPRKKAIHAGIETGIIGEKFKNMDMVSIGPEIKNPHSPDEKINIKTVKKFWKLLTESLMIITK